MKKSDYEKTKYPNIFKHKTNGTYAIDISLGYDSRGKRIRTTRSGIKKEKEAREILQNIKLKKYTYAEDMIVSNAKAKIRLTIANSSVFSIYFFIRLFS